MAAPAHTLKYLLGKSPKFPLKHPSRSECYQKCSHKEKSGVWMFVTCSRKHFACSNWVKRHCVSTTATLCFITKKNWAYGWLDCLHVLQTIRAAMLEKLWYLNYLKDLFLLWFCSVVVCTVTHSPNEWKCPDLVLRGVWCKNLPNQKCRLNCSGDPWWI